MRAKVISCLRKIMQIISFFMYKVRGLWADVQYKGVYNSWEEANIVCKGYDADEIFEKVKKSTLAVVNGEAIYERDAVLFYEKQYNYPLLSYLLTIDREYKRLNVIDWGGSLGSTYFQNRHFLDNITNNYSWTVIEQKHFVEFGKKSINDAKLSFQYNLNELKRIEDYQCIIFSSVLQYLDFAVSLCKQVVELKIPYIIIERQPVAEKDIITVEYVKEPIYNATYPAHFFAEEEFCRMFTECGYKLIDSWNSLVDSDVWIRKNKVTFKSFVFCLEK